MFPPCEKFSIALNSLREERNIPAFFNHLLKKVNKDTKTAVFQNMKTKELTEVGYDFLHISPAQTAPEFIAKSPLAGAGGFVACDKETMQHPKYENVFSLGDCVALPCSKTAASLFSQAPVLVHNMVKVAKGSAPNAKYDGYGSCPLFVGDRKLMLAEFKYGGKPHETVTNKQEIPNVPFYYLKKEFFPRVYFNISPKGKWFGNKMIFKPNFF